MAFANPYSPVVTKVSLPFCSPIPAGLTNGTQIHIQGVVKNVPGVDGFAINLSEGSKVEPNTPLHFNVRFNQNCIVRNTMHGDSWGDEERDGGMPMTKGTIFEIIIMCTPSAYNIAVNGRHFTEYKHRLPMAKAKFLSISGNGLNIKFIKYEGGNVDAAAPAGFGPSPPPPYTAGGFVVPPGTGAPAGKATHPYNGPLYNPPVPLCQPIPGNMSPNKMIFISGTPHFGGKRFSINLQNGFMEDSDICFHFDVRFSFGDSQSIVVRNTKTCGEWGNEERDASYFPFMPNAAFDVIILADPYTFKVAVNNTHFIAYAHREPLVKSNTLTITGDVKITSLRIQ